MALSLMDYVFSWSLTDVLNQQLYKDKVKKIPKTFTSAEEYLASYTYPLIEETHAALCSSMKDLSPRAPKCRILEIENVNKTQKRDLYYKIQVSKDGDSKNGKEPYDPQVGDLMLLSNVKCFSIADLKRSGTSLFLALVTGDPFSIIIRSSRPIELEAAFLLRKSEPIFAVFLINLIPSLRIWKALHPEMKVANMNVINEVLCTNSTVGIDCHCCLLSQDKSICGNPLLSDLQTFNLDESQTDAVVTAIATRGCNHKSSVKLIWGPPGTGKTKTVSVLLCVLRRMKSRTLICTPTNISLIEVTLRLKNLVKTSLKHHNNGLGDIVLYGNKSRLQIDDYPDIHDVFLDYRTAELRKCFSGWNQQLNSLIALLEEGGYWYLRYLEQKEKEKEDESRRSTGVSKTELKENKQENVLTIDEFIKERFTHIWMDLKFFITTLLKHLPTSFISVRVVEDMNKALHFLDSLQTLLHGSVTKEDLICVFLDSDDLKTAVGGSNTLLLETTRNKCLQILKTLNESFSAPNFKDSSLIRDFCLQRAYLIFSTASGSAKLHTEGMMPFELLVIDEAAQLKECESTIPLQLPGVRHAILIGDEQQLTATVQSKISEEAEFGRSLFERLVSLGHKKHLLNIQYRMHPSISLFPNTEFYGKQILDAPKVKESNHERHFLQGNMYGAYSFINIAHGTEAPGHGKKNMVEVAVVSKIVKSLFKASVASGQKFSVGVISPYNAQVLAIKEKLGRTCDTVKDFSVCVRTVDGFQGGAEDVIIVSTVRSNGKGLVGFLENHQRTNVALTRARYCLWVLGNGPTLIDSGSIWGKLVLDAKDRGCFFDAEKDKNLREAIIDGLVELGEFDKLFRTDSLLFDGTRWKVLFVNDFSKSMAKIRRTDTQKEVIALLVKLANGWRHPKKQENLYLTDSISSELLEVYNVDGSSFKLVWTVDILAENHKHTQVIKVWDILPLEEISELAKRLDIFFGKYKTDDINRRKFRCSEGDIEVPMSWEISSATTSGEECLSSTFTSLHLGRNQMHPENDDADKPTITRMKQRSRAGNLLSYLQFIWTAVKDLFWHMVNSI